MHSDVLKGEILAVLSSDPTVEIKRQGNEIKRNGDKFCVSSEGQIIYNDWNLNTAVNLFLKRAA